MSIFGKLFGGGSKPGKEPEVYKDFRIFPQPQSAPGGFRIGARIEKDVDGETKVHQLLRADIIQGAEEAEHFSLLKARQVIDEQGEALFR
ncbi:HlyU family transcriptional regulator [Roseibacterium sp. SDUM158017]|uniref:HlyU family transcriptional regulator n=1 Tax=Roseicyclus salinarum TaxID=3036773 RepID=UPI0024154178|nr:HlyU family transcriptional regulator [Roseibacterium sp. SDUM158017]MDG4647407.1 HlyU family transcriptional regulator [Roseibacterium sp. SDUM158017]